GADGDENHASAVLEERRVLITVRVHLDRSALGPGLIEEREYDRLSLEVGETDRVRQDAVARGAAQAEVGRLRADLERTRLLRREHDRREGESKSEYQRTHARSV